MSGRHIKVRFGKEPGQIEAETEGFKGPACQESMQRVLGNLGQLVSSESTEEFFEDPDPTQEAESQNG